MSSQNLIRYGPAVVIAIGVAGIFLVGLDSQKTCFLECGGWMATSFFLSVVVGKAMKFSVAGRAMLAGGDHAGMRPKENIANMQGKKRKHVPDPGDEMQLTFPLAIMLLNKFLLGENQCL